MASGNEPEKTAEAAKSASFKLANLDEKEKNRALRAIAAGLVKNRNKIIDANRDDVKKARKNGKGSAFIDRLMLDDERIDKMAESVLVVEALPDPVGEVIKTWRRPNALEISKVRVPLGVIAIIYESRPDVGVQAGALCLKSGNCVILRGGSDAGNSNIEIVKVMKQACENTDLSPECIQIIKDASHDTVKELLKMNRYIDLVMPRGGEALIRMVSENSRIPVIKHYKGVCHVYVDNESDGEMAHEICFNAKVQRPGVCNAMETMLVHKDIAGKFLKKMLSRFREAGVQIRGDERVRRVAGWVKPATMEDWDAEYLDLILSVRVVDSIDEAISHINEHGSKHSDAIVTFNYDKARKFLRLVDSAVVYVNASTRFTDGGEFGFGAEIGISTDKFHARGPMGLEELTSYKYMVYGNGQVRE